MASSSVNSHDIQDAPIAGVTVARLFSHFSDMPKKPPATENDIMAGRRLRAVREAFDERGPIRQESFANIIGVTRTALANWEAGKLPDVRAMVRLNAWLGIPLEWIYLGHLRHVEYDLAERLAAAAAKVGASIHAPTPEWPMATSRRPGTAADRVPGLTPRHRPGPTLHEPSQPRFPKPI